MKLRFLAAFLPALALCAEIRVGIIGTDTSHVPAFTKLLNDSSSPDHIPGARVVAAYKGGSPDVESSRTRVDKFAEEIRSKYGVEIVPDIPTLLSKVDAVLIESVDGRAHLEQARPVITARKPLFIDKPLSATLDDAVEIARLARQAGTPWFSTSSLRYGEIATTMRHADAMGAITWGPGPTEEHHYLDLAWYAIHPIEMLYALLGPGCESVTRVSTAAADEVTCRWKDGRLGTVRALRPYSGYGAVVFRPKQVVQSPADAKSSYIPLVKEIVKFFETRKPPVANEETLEIFAFMDAAQRSKEAGGAPVKLRCSGSDCYNESTRTSR
jgi:predicted dehydrogenase